MKDLLGILIVLPFAGAYLWSAQAVANRYCDWFETAFIERGMKSFLEPNWASALAITCHFVLLPVLTAIVLYNAAHDHPLGWATFPDRHPVYFAILSWVPFTLYFGHIFILARTARVSLVAFLLTLCIWLLMIGLAARSYGRILSDHRPNKTVGQPPTRPDSK